eukprot:4086359-Amphidinium_carterae.1
MTARMKSVWIEGVVCDVLKGVDKAGKLRKFGEVRADFVHLTADAVQFVDTAARRASAFRHILVEDEDPWTQCLQKLLLSWPGTGCSLLSALSQAMKRSLGTK